MAACCTAPPAGTQRMAIRYVPLINSCKAAAGRVQAMAGCCKGPGGGCKRLIGRLKEIALFIDKSHSSPQKPYTTGQHN
ncbi:hypothetical protein [Paraflavitalea speifideaquila]|uniref:hypothetical protein n=1 Tax=Paraflavitalea speifideaquila TaxID=3076558 RepID=UPI0028F0169B|nr:hypothetical protein [Paraflavitalea speifideiaquila]